MDRGMYKILHNYNSEGYHFYRQGRETEPAEYGSVAAAVKAALEANYSTPFLIVQVVDWEAQEINN